MPNMLDTPQTLPEVLAHAARTAPTRGIRVFDRRGRESEFRAYPQVLASAREAAGRWAALGVRPGDRVVVCLPTTWNLLEAWWGAVLLGARPVCVAPGGAMGSQEAHLRKLEGIVERLGAARMLCDESLVQEVEAAGMSRARRLALGPEAFAKTTPASGVRIADPEPEELAFLQLTSGSTGIPRAVMIPHRAGVHNPRAIAESVRAPSGHLLHDLVDGIVSWLPLNHDMGLVGCLLFAIVHGIDLALMRPDTTFLMRPQLWLQQLGLNGRTLAPAPNFAYQLCVQRVDPEHLKGVNLGNWYGAMTGAEMVRPETCAAFSEKFAAAGFRPETFRPCYGLAEATLAVTFDVLCRGVRTRPMPKGADSGLGLNEVVCNGRPVTDTEVVIAAPDGSALPAGSIGQVRVKGPGVFAGYYNDTEGTREGLQNGWLVTGDLGFLHDGELYLTGRTKDLLIVHGHNVMPHELEWIAEACGGGDGGGAERCGAFSVAKDAEGEQAVLVMEVSEREGEALADLEREIRQRIGRQIGLPLSDVVFVKRGKVPRTTSGKVQRRELRRRYIDGELERL
ncbi:MAG: AMP-binding protein [Planctomycetes bacterium]|nr:AMP-binding protein [Planctomycetota bacterium]